LSKTKRIRTGGRWTSADSFIHAHRGLTRKHSLFKQSGGECRGKNHTCTAKRQVKQGGLEKRKGCIGGDLNVALNKNMDRKKKKTQKKKQKKKKKNRPPQVAVASGKGPKEKGGRSDERRAAYRVAFAKVKRGALCLHHPRRARSRSHNGKKKGESILSGGGPDLIH